MEKISLLIFVNSVLRVFFIVCSGKRKAAHEHHNQPPQKVYPAPHGRGLYVCTEIIYYIGKLKSARLFVLTTGYYFFRLAFLSLSI